MPRKAKKVDVSPGLIRFVLVSISGTNELAGTGAGKVDMKREFDAVIETIAPDEKNEFCRLVVRLTLAIGGRRERDEADMVRVEGKYEGRFALPPGVTIEQLDAVAGEESFQYAVVSQVFPLAMIHLKDQLELMGLSTQRLPMGV